MVRTFTRVRTGLAVIVAAAIVASGCLGPAPQPPPPNPPPPVVMTSFSTIQEGTGYRQIFEEVHLDGSFPVAAALDPVSHTMFAEFKNGSIKFWDFSNESSIVNRTWALPGAPCPNRAEIRVLLNRTALVPCGSQVLSFDEWGVVLSNITFGGNLTAFDVVPRAGLLVGGLGMGNATRLEVRRTDDGTLVRSMEIGKESGIEEVLRLGVDADGQVAGILAPPGPTLHFYNLTRVGSHASGDLGAIDFAPNSSVFWMLTITGGASDRGQLRQFGNSDFAAPTMFVDLDRVVILDNSARHFVYSSGNGSEAAVISEFATSANYSDGSSLGGNDARTAVRVFDTAGRVVRGMGVPDASVTQIPVDVVTVAIGPAGELYVVSFYRTPLHGAQMWLSYGAPDCTPPRLAWTNAT